MLKSLIVWITTNCGKLLKRWEYQTTLPASWEICMQVKKQYLEPDMEEWTGSKVGKEYVKTVYCHPAYLTSMQSKIETEISQPCLTLCDPMDCSLPGSCVHGISQARILEWVDISFSRGSSKSRDQTQVSCIAHHAKCWTGWSSAGIKIWEKYQ